MEWLDDPQDVHDGRTGDGKVTIRARVHLAVLHAVRVAKAQIHQHLVVGLDAPREW